MLHARRVSVDLPVGLSRIDTRNVLTDFSFLDF